MEEWASLESMGFPGYELSNMGEVRNSQSLRVLKMSPNQEGIVRVGLMRREEGRQVTVSVVRLVARMFVSGRSATFDTPIQLNGDRTDLRASNIMWRPRWFAIRYFQQFEESDVPFYGGKIFDLETNDVYDNSRDASTKNGLLERVVLESVFNGSPCFPTWQIFAQVSH
jgi:hypothetical protein